MLTRIGEASVPQRRPARAQRFFTDREWAIVDAMAARIIPASATAGARETGAVCFIDGMLAGPYSVFQSTYRDGLRCLVEFCARSFGRSFEQLEAGEQDRILSLLESGQLPDWCDAAAFFETVRTHTIEGHLSDPKYGGNRDAAGWAGLL